ncbi:AMP-binding protein [Saccharomonospora cyanea]|uniref:Acyl-CoA synthetase (AMP-forming)/AMP-acid ligase II n=1 Tax=Saccharomonospora cyanea NA-134 TaxID=882082 RepID=H5XHJ1_9PSEU|nr:AMP-binding protein [Saccharomonospora cyanea]EHR61671.1 acyl-CoA synthetase (AMP-forming)/AMP-acid ligase II [Saccharomonospora cyanea NA-134]
MGSETLVAPGARLVGSVEGRVLEGAGLRREIDRVKTALDRLPGGAVASRTAPCLPSVLRLLAAFETGRPILLVPPRLSAGQAATLAEAFGLRAVLGLDDVEPVREEPPAGFRVDDDPELSGWVRSGRLDVTPHDDLALLLTTSGSTGAAKAVRLSAGAVRANAVSIGQALGIDGRQVAPTSLPLHYSYGLSVLTSHLLVGATVVLCDGGVLSPRFWRAVDEHGATSLAGVPHTYETLDGIRWRPGRNPTLRTLTQAGGRLAPRLVRRFGELAEADGLRMFVMYGQTEATARMTVLPAERLKDKLGSVGLPIPGGRVDIDDGEVVYHGPNVMLGYAEGPEDLARGDELGGTLRTGDLGRLDEEGFLWLTGRRSRVGKVFGTRVDLDVVERALDDVGPVAALDADDRVAVWSASGAGEDEVRARLVREFGLPRAGFLVHHVTALPRLPNGKIDYQRLRATDPGRTR